MSFDSNSRILLKATAAAVLTNSLRQSCHFASYIYQPKTKKVVMDKLNIASSSHIDSSL